MGEVQEQRYVCKICNKSCVSGKSLGGHMRVHLALIAASKKAAEAKAVIKMEINGVEDQDGSSQLKESSKNQSNSGQEKVKNWGKNMDSGDGDQSNSYELRENPKKSWRICNLKHGVVKNGGSCKECGREFPSLRALSGHMRSHSIKNKKLHHCKTCGKGFDSMRAMFGHMKSHSKRLRVPDDSADSLSDFENLCPVRRKRSRIRYKSSSNPSFSSLNGSNCDVSEVEDVEEVAMCLMMLSRGVKNWIKSDSVQESESSDDGSVYFGGELSRKSKNFDVNNDDSVCDVDRKTKMSLSAANAFAEKNVSEFDDLNEKRVDFEVSDETKVALEVCDDEQPSVSKLVESVPLNEFVVELGCADDTRSFGSTKFVEPGKDLSGANGRKNLSENEATDLEILRDFDRMQGTDSKADSKLDQFECGENQLEQESLRAGTAVLESKENKEHFSCPICLKVFRSGQALGGHKRAHYTGWNESKIEKAMAVNKEFDLNFPVAVDEGATTELGLNLWWAERNREHEALMLTN